MALKSFSEVKVRVTLESVSLVHSPSASRLLLSAELQPDSEPGPLDSTAAFSSVSPVEELSSCPVFRDEEEAPARLQLHPARQWLPRPLSAANPALLWKVRLICSYGSKRGKIDSLLIA